MAKRAINKAHAVILMGLASIGTGSPAPKSSVRCAIKTSNEQGLSTHEGLSKDRAAQLLACNFTKYFAWVQQ
jgi:hypothetical protein